MARLPQPGSDNGTWGEILNDYLSQTLKPDGSLKNDIISSAHIADGAINEQQLDPDVRTKLNTTSGNPDWADITGKPTVIASGVDQAAARASIALGNVDNTSDSAKNSASAVLTNKTISGSHNTLSNIPSSAVIDATHIGVFPFELPLSTGTFIGNQPVSNRRLFRISQSVKRFRVHVKNRDQLLDENATGSLTNVTLYIGEPAVDASGTPNGNFTASPTQIQTATTVASGTELTTSWIPRSTFAIDANKLGMLSIGFHMPSTGRICFSGSLTWQTLNASDAAVAAPAGLTRVNNAAFLQIYIEYEYENDHTPSILVVGNSLSNGSNGGGVDNNGELTSWPQIWALRNGGVAASLAVAGSWAAHFGPGNTRWDVYSGLSAPINYDTIVYFALNSSDLAGGSTAVAENNMTVAIARGKALYPNARHVVTNIPPRVAFTAGVSEDARLLVNEWMHMLPGGVEQCVDIDAVITDWANPARIRSVYDADGTHMSPRGHSAVAATFPTFRK